MGTAKLKDWEKKRLFKKAQFMTTFEKVVEARSGSLKTINVIHQNL